MNSPYNFVSELAVGHVWATKVADYLNSHGVACRVTEMRVAQTPEEIPEFTENEKDIELIHMSGYIEVKSRNLHFTSDPESFPHAYPFVDTKSGWEAKKQKPVAVVMISQVTGEMLVVRTTTEKYWGTQHAFDQTRGYPDTFLTVHRGFLRPINSLIQHLKNSQP